MTRYNTSIYSELREIPVESFGDCRNDRCCITNEYLANGYCTKCWDRGLGSGMNFVSEFVCEKMHTRRNREAA